MQGSEKMIRIAIVDDELPIAKLVARITHSHAEQLNIPVSLTIFQSSQKFLNEYHTGKFDVAFLDIEMPEMNGDILSAELIKIDQSLLLVYVTNCCNDEVYTMLKYMPIGFLRKPLFEKEIDNMLNTLQSKLQTIQRIYKIQSKKQITQIPLKEVLYIDSIKNYVYFHLKEKSSEIKIRKKLDEVQKDIEDYGFIRIHSSILVNYRFIFSIKKHSVILDNGEVLLISRSHETNVTQQFLYFSRR
jgi:DNA-binding LytR/AlgR family response regulator